jgi:hypothetical protein
MNNKELKKLKRECVNVIKAMQWRTRQAAIKFATVARILSNDCMESIFSMPSDDLSELESNNDDEEQEGNNKKEMTVQQTSPEENDNRPVDYEALKQVLQEINTMSPIGKNQAKKTRSILTKAQQVYRKRKRQDINEQMETIEQTKPLKRTRFVLHTPSNDRTRMVVSIDMARAIIAYIDDMQVLLTLRQVSRDMFALIHSDSNLWPILRCPIAELKYPFHDYKSNFFPWVRYAVIFSAYHASRTERQRRQLYALYNQYKRDIVEASLSMKKNKKRRAYQQANFNFFDNVGKHIVTGLLRQVHLIRKGESNISLIFERDSVGEKLYTEYECQIQSTVFEGCKLKDLVTGVFDYCCLEIMERNNTHRNLRTYGLHSHTMMRSDSKDVHVENSQIVPKTTRNTHVFYHFTLERIVKPSQIAITKKKLITELNGVMKTLKQLSDDHDDDAKELAVKTSHDRILDKCPLILNLMGTRDIDTAMTLVKPEYNNEYYLYLTLQSKNCQSSDYIDSTHCFAYLDHEKQEFVSM